MLVEVMKFGREERAACTSLDVAETFGKEHKNALRDIRGLGCGEEFNRLNFEPNFYLSNEQLNKLAEEIAGEMEIPLIDKKEEPFMKITYNGYTGELWEFKRLPGRMNGKVICNITILCQDCAKVSFESVRLEDLRFSGANVSFGG